jgi:hypothetical protein
VTSADINDLYLRAESFSVPGYEHAQIVDATGSRTAALVVVLKRAAFSGAGSATLIARLQHSNDLGNWFSIASPVTFTLVATGVGDVSGEAKGVADIAVQGFRWLRTEYSLTTSGPVVGAVLSASMNTVVVGQS